MDMSRMPANGPQVRAAGFPSLAKKPRRRHPCRGKSARRPNLSQKNVNHPHHVMNELDHPLFFRPDGRPLPPMHHLDTHRGAFRIRATIDQGAKFTGKRICVPLRTRDPHLAEKMRDMMLEGWARAGVLCRDIVLSDDEVGLERGCQSSELAPRGSGRNVIPEQ